MKRLQLVLAVLVFQLSLSAQMSSDIRIGYLGLLGGTHVNSIGFGGGLTRMLGDRAAMSFTALLYFGGKQEATMTATANSTFISPATMEVPVSRKFLLYSGAFTFRYYLLGGLEEDEGLYGFAGIGALKGKVTNKSVGSYDASRYYLPGGGYPGEWDGLEGFTGDLGVGYEQLFGSVYLVAEMKYHHLFLDLGESASHTGFVLPSAISVDAGLRFPF